MDNYGTVIYAGPHYERNVGTGATTSDVTTKMYWGQLGPMRRLIAVRKGGVLSYLHHDHLGSAKAISGTSGGPMKYYPFGSTYQEIASPPTDNLYNGQKRDLSTGLYFYGARYYNVSSGTFTQPDSIVPNPGNPQSFNRYSYGYNNPLKYTDPTGHYVVFVGGVGTDNDPDKNQEAWGSMIRDMGLKEGEYEFFDWSAGGRYSGTPSDYRLLDGAAKDLAGTVAGRKDVTLIGHSKGGDLVLEYLAQVAEGGLAGNPEINRAFILDSPTTAGGAGGARLPRYGLKDPDRSNVWDRLANVPTRVKQSTGGAMNVDVAMIANPRDPVSGPPVPGIPYFSFPSGSALFSGVPVLNWIDMYRTSGRVHGAVQADPLVAGFINWYKRG